MKTSIKIPLLAFVILIISGCSAFEKTVEFVHDKTKPSCTHQVVDTKADLAEHASDYADFVESTSVSQEVRQKFVNSVTGFENRLDLAGGQCITNIDEAEKTIEDVENFIKEGLPQ